MEQSPIIETIKKVIPAVVSIIISKEMPVMAPGQLEFFEEAPSQDPENKNKKVQIGGGSGFIVYPNGVILSNKHVVVEPDAEYTVVLSDGKKYQAAVIARDEINDVAILKIEVENLPTIPLGDSENLQLGQTALSFGNALGIFQNTVCTGIVSGLSRLITAHTGMGMQTERLRGLVQTDAAINPGNSGGPLCDIEGNAIGINVAMVMGAENIGFAIPINTAKKDLLELKKFGRIRRPFLGVRYFIIDPEVKKRFKLPADYGALVVRENLPGDHAVVPGSTADKAGLKEFDIILECNAKKITPETPLSDHIADLPIGAPLALKIMRQGKEEVLQTILEECEGCR
jgi:S1-C subfamily serine protease